MRALMVMAGAAFLVAWPAAPQTVWNDVSGQGRGNGQLQMSDGQCQMYAQQQATNIVVPPNCRQCAIISAASAIANKQAAYTNCMHAQGWERAAAAPRQSNVSGSVVYVVRSFETGGVRI